MTVEEILAALQAILDGANDRELTDEEVERYEQLEGQLEKRKKRDEIEKRNAAYNTPTTSPVFADTSTKKDDTLERAFEHYLRTGKENADIVELRAQSVGTDSAGGFTVPDTMRQKLQERMVAFGGLASVVETISTSGGEPLRWPTLDDTANEGVIAAENTAPGSGGADLVFGEKTLGAFRYVAPGAGQLPLRVSVELLQDSAFDIQGLITRKLGERIGRAQAAHWVTGNGTTEPFGIDTGTSTTGLFPLSGITYDSLVDAVHEVDPAYRQSATWSFNDATLAQIEKIVDGNGRPLLSPAGNGINTGPTNATLLGYPVVVDQAFPDQGTASAEWGVFGDLRQGYVIRRVQDMTLIVNPYSQANEGQVEYVLWARADGVPQDTFAYRVLTDAAA